MSTSTRILVRERDTKNMAVFVEVSDLSNVEYHFDRNNNRRITPAKDAIFPSVYMPLHEVGNEQVLQVGVTPASALSAS